MRAAEARAMLTRFCPPKARAGRGNSESGRNDLDQDLVGDVGAPGLAAVHHRAEGDGLHRHARVQRSNCPGTPSAPDGADRHLDAAGLAHGVAVEHQIARVRYHQMQQQPRQRGLAAAGLPDHAQGMPLEQGERHAIHGAHHGALACALHPEMALQLARDQHRLSGAPAVPRMGIGLNLNGGAHPRTSIAPRTPSLTRLKQIEVMKIAMPGNAQPSGST